MTVLIDPGAFREVHRMCQELGDGGGRLEVLSLAATDGVDMHVQPQAPAAQPDAAAADAADRCDSLQFTLIFSSSAEPCKYTSNRTVTPL